MDKELQPLRTLAPRKDTESGMVKVVKDLQSLKAHASIRVNFELGSLKLVNEMQPLNACDPMRHTESGMDKLVKDLQS